MEQAESLPKLEENTEQLECTESLSPAVDPLLLKTGTSGKNVASYKQPMMQLCHTLLRRWHELQAETKHRLRYQLRVQLSPSTDNIVTIELSDEEDEVLQQSNTKTRIVDDAAETALGDTLQKDDGEPKSANDLMPEEKNDETLALSAKELEMGGRDVMQENRSEDMTTDNVLEQEADGKNPSRNGDEEMFTCIVKVKNIALDNELHAGGGNTQNLVQQTISKDMMSIVDIPEQQPGNKDLNERVVNENSKSTVRPDREINVHTLHLSEDKVEAEVRRDKSKLWHENRSKIGLINNDVPEQKNHKKNSGKHISDHLIIIKKKKKVSCKRPKIRTERELVVRNENISTLREQVETRLVKTSSDPIQPNHSKYMSDQNLQMFRKDYYFRKSISVKSYEGFGENSKKVSKNNNSNMTLNVYKDLDEGYRLFSSPKPTVIGDYLIHEDDPGLEANILANYVNKNNARSEVGIKIGDKNTPSPESNILKELQEIDVSNIEAIINFDSDDENATMNNGISGDVNKNSSNRVIKTYSAFRRNTTQGDNETTNIGTHDNRKNSRTVNVNNVIKTYEGYNRIRKRKSCELKHDISKQVSAVTDNNNDATILETGSDNAKGCNKKHYSHNKKPRKRHGNESIDIVLRDHNYVDMNRRSSCSSAGAGTDNAEVEVAADATDPKLLMRPVVVIKKLKEQIWDEASLSHVSRSSTPNYDSTSPPRSPVAHHESPSALVTPQSSRSTSGDSSTPAPKSVKKRRARQMLLNEDINERSRLTKKVELPDIEEVRRHNRNMLTAQVTPITQYQGTASCDHNKSPNASSSTASLAGCPRCAAQRTASPDDDGGDGRLRRGAASRARSFITTISKKRKYILSKVKQPHKHKPIFVGVKPYRRKRRRRRPRFTSPPDDFPADDEENMPIRDLIILENEEATTRSDNPVPHSETITSNCSDTPSILNEGLPTHNLATDQRKQDTILSSNSVTGFESVPSNGAFSTPNENVTTLSLSTTQKEQDTACSFNPMAHVNSAQLLQSSNDGPAALIEDYSSQQLTKVQKEKELRHKTIESSDAVIECVSTQNLSKSRKEQEPPRSLKRVTFNIPMQDVTAIQKELKKSSVNPLKIGAIPRRKRKQVRLCSEPPDDASSVVKNEPMRDLIILDNNYDICSLRPASSSAVPVLDEDVSMRELTTTQSNQETNAYHRNSVPSNTAPSISNEGLPTQGLTIVRYPTTRTYGFTAPSSSNARDLSVLNKNVQTRDVITTLNNQKRAPKRATRIGSVPSIPYLIKNERETCKRVTLPLPTASLNERRSSVGSMLYASKPLTEKVKACEERKQQKQSSNCGFKPLLFRRGSISKKAPKEDFVSLHELGTTNFSNVKGNEIKCLGISKDTGSCDSMLANNGTTLIPLTLPICTQTNIYNIIENQNNSLKPVSEIASDNSVPNVAELNQLLSSREVVDAPQAECDPVIISVQSLAPTQEIMNDRNLRTPAPKSTVQVSDGTNKSSVPVITLKQAKPVCVSYLTNPSREIHDFTSDSKGPKEVTRHLPKMINVSSYTNKQVKSRSTDDRENCHNRAATLKRSIISSEQVTSPMTTHLPKVIRESDRSVESLGPELIQPRALPKITLKRAHPVYASYHSANDMEVLISEPREEGQEEMHLPRVGDVAGDLHVIQPDDRMGLHLVVSQDEVYNDSLKISQPNF